MLVGLFGKPICARELGWRPRGNKKDGGRRRKARGGEGIKEEKNLVGLPSCPGLLTLYPDSCCLFVCQWNMNRN